MNRISLRIVPLLLLFSSMLRAGEPKVWRDLPYAEPKTERQTLDVYAPREGKDHPVVFWIHGGGWQVGDKTDVQSKPQAFLDKGFVFVSTNYRLVPCVDMETINRDIAKSIRWVHDHIAEYGGDPQHLFIMGHSAGAQLAALISIDDRYLKAEGLSLDTIKGCVPVDGDTFDVPAIIETVETRRRVHGQPQAKYSDRQKFGNDPAKHRDLSAVTHVAHGKGIPPFLILHVADHPDTTAQAQRLGNVLKEAGVPMTIVAAPDTTHKKINVNLGLRDDPATIALFEFLGDALNANAPELSPAFKPLLTKPGRLLFSEDLSQVPHERDKQNKKRGGWQSGKGKWEIKDGVLVGAEKPEEKHGAMLTKPGLAFHNAAVQVSFRLDGAKGITLDANSFALGRIIAVTVTSTSLKLARSLEGGDRMEVLDTMPLKLEPGTWYTLLLEMQGKDLVASIDGKQIVFCAGERIDVDKTSVQLRIGGESVAFKNLRVWEAAPGDTWEATKAKLLDARKTNK